MERQQVGGAEAIQSIIDILSVLAVNPYLQLVRRNVMTTTEAAEAMKNDASVLERMKLPAPFVGFAVAKAVREYAAVFDRTPEGQPPALRLVPGGRADDEQPDS